MNFIISGKNIEVTAGLRETIEQKRNWENLNGTSLLKQRSLLL